MPKCRNCVHWEACREYVTRLAAARGVDLNATELEQIFDSDDCDHFHDRSRFVELPCKVYTTFIGRVVEAKIYGYEASMKNSNCSWTIEPQHFGKYVFFTQEAAEQALKERESNAGQNDT